MLEPGHVSPSVMQSAGKARCVSTGLLRLVLKMLHAQTDLMHISGVEEPLLELVTPAPLASS